MTLDKSTPSILASTQFRKDTPLPVNWHHVFFPPMIGERDLGQDGYEMTHAPPAPFLARMWAGGGVEQNPANLLRVGQDMSMTTKCTGVDIKQNRSGEVMVFVSLEKLIENEHGWALTDTRTLVYMEKDEKKVNPTKPKLVKRCLVHGPLSATYMLENLRQHLKPGMIMKNFRYRALSPLYVDQSIKICAKQMPVVPTMDADVIDSYEVWVQNPDGGLAMSGTVEIVQEPNA
ncbi:hypothetical protein BGZ50_002658 [Haplosporangium sp. Z 11]|nr:hypothetical protein BGZ50_002658 [Haplosporangium sp. Z 11]